MDNQINETSKAIGIIGGGKVGLQLFDLFSQGSLSKVIYVADINSSAPAVIAAQKAGVATFTNLSSALDIEVDFIFEVTGRTEAVETIRERISQSDCQLITHEMAQIILRVIQENNQRVKSQSVSEIKQIKTEIAGHLARLERFIGEVENIMAEMKMLSLNARIEAARVGEAGQGFRVVASEMGKSLASVVTITNEIDQITQAITQTSNEIDISLTRLL
jgi:twitching motility protein PilJ